MTKRNYFSVVILTLFSVSFSQTTVSVSWTSECFAKPDGLSISLNTTRFSNSTKLTLNSSLTAEFNKSVSNMQIYTIKDPDSGLYIIDNKTVKVNSEQNDVTFVGGEISETCYSSFCIDKSSTKTMIIDSSDRKDGYFKKFSFKVESYDNETNQVNITFRIGNKTDEAQELTCTRNLTTINCDTSDITFKKNDVKTTRKFKLYLKQCGDWYDTSYHIEVKDTSSLFISISKMLIFTFFIIF